MKRMRLCKVLGACLGGGLLLQTTGGCDTSALTSQLVSSIVPLLIDFALSALLGGAI